MARTSLPPGFRFHPTDVELVKYYLKRKVMGKRIHFEAISEIDIYKFAPWDLPGKSCLRSKDLEWYFFCPRVRKYANGSRMNRATEFGYWKTTGKDRPVLYNKQIVGMIKTLVFHRGRAPHGDRTDWVMHEYRLEDKDLADTAIIQDVYVLCKIFQKSGPGPKNGAQYGAPFNEEDWNDDVEVNYVESFPFLAPSSAAPVLPNNQNSVASILLLGTTCSGSSSESGPSKTVQSPDKILPTVPDDDSVSTLEVPPPSENDDILLMLASFTEDSTLFPNESGKNEELDKVTHEGIVEAGSSLDCNDIFNNLEDLFKLSELSDNGLNSFDAHKAEFAPDQMLAGEGLYLELIDLESPLKCPAEANGSEHILTNDVSGHYNICNNTEQPLYLVNPLGTVQPVSLFSPSPVLPEGSYGFKDHLDVYQKENGVKESANQGYQEYETTSNNANVTLCNQSVLLGGRHAPQVRARGEQQRKYYSEFQQLLESIPARPASAAEHPDPINGVTRFKGSIALLSSYGCSSIHVKAEVTLGGGDGCTKDALSGKLEEFPCLCCYGCNLPGAGRELRREVAACGSGVTFHLFLVMFLALMGIFMTAMVIKLGRCAWSHVFS